MTIWLTITDAFKNGLLFKADSTVPTKDTVIRWCRETINGEREWFKSNNDEPAVKLEKHGGISFYLIQQDALENFEPVDNRRIFGVETARQIHQMAAGGITPAEIAEHLELAEYHVNSLLAGRTWKAVYDEFNS